MATQIGIITTLIGTATATAADGSIRDLQVGDQVFADELVSTGAGSAVEITFEDGSIMDLGRNSQAVLDSEAYDPTVVQDVIESTASDVEAIQQALLEGVDPTQITEATAAGAGAETGGNEGSTPVYVDYLAPEVIPDSGFDTTGISAELSAVEEAQETTPIDTGVDAVNDVNSVAEGDVDNDGINNITSGNVITENDEQGNDTPATITAISGGNVGATGFATAQGGWLIINSDGSYLYTAPDSVDNTNPVSEVFTYTLTDSDGSTDTATLTLTVTDTGVDAVNDVNSVAEGDVDNDGTNNITSGNVITENDEQGNDTPATITAISGGNVGATGFATAQGGWLIINSDGSYLYTAPDSVDNTNPVSEVFTYTLTDSDGSTDTATLTLTVTDTGVDAVNDVNSVAEGDVDNNGTNNITSGNVITENDEQGNDTPATITAISGGNVGATGFATAQGGWLIINSDGSYLYTAPDSVDNTNPVSEVFTYTLTDSDGSTDTATLTLTVTDTGVDAVNDVNSVAEGDVDNDGTNNITSGNVITENDEQGNDTPATITAISGGNVGATGFATAQGGWLIINSDGSYLYTAPDSVDNTNPVSEVFTYTLTDSDGSTDTATLTLTVTDTGVDAVNDVNSVAEGDVDNDGTNNITSGNVITENDEQGNDTPATITAISGGNVGATGFATAQGGWLIINSDGSYLYTAPDSVDNTNPVSEVFTYTLTDSDGSTDTATLTLTVTDTGVDAVNDVNSVAEGDVDNDGTNNITSGNVITENDEQGNDTPATITAISGGNVGATGFATAQGGWLIINSDGSYLYTAPDSVDNTNPVSEVFTYTLTDSDGSTDTATLTLTVTDTGVDAVNDVNSVAEGDVDNDGTNNITSGNVITENDEQGNDTPATITAISGGNVGATGFATAQGGWLIINSDGSYLYTAPDSVDNTNPVSEVFTYTLTDSDGSTDTATLTLTVTDTGVDAVNDVNSVAEGDADNDGTNNITSGNVITENDEQGNDTPATITAISGGNVGATGFATAQGGWLIINSDGSYLYTAPDSVDNTNPVSEVFTYTLTDSDGSTDTATLTLTVTDTGVDAVNDVNSVAEGDVDNDGTNNITSGNVITENDEQGNDTPATITAISGGNVGATGFATAQGGWLIINSDGSYLYTAPDSVDNTNPVSEVFTYTLTDSDGSTDTATLTLTVTDTGVDAVNDVNSVAEGDVDNDGTNNITSGNVITENDEQGNDTPATITAISGGNVGATGFATAQGGWLIINSDGSYLYTAPDSVDNTNPVSEVFTYTLTDSDGSTDTATLTLTVTDTGVDAVNDVNSVAEGDVDNDGTNNITSGNVITENDEQGNDTPATITAISGGNVGATGFATAQGGWLIINSDGSYLYTAPDSVDNTNPVSEVFTYTLTDSDGSTDTATLTLTVTDTGVDAVNDVNSVAEGDADNDGTNNITSGNVITENDEQGNDTPATITAISGGNVGATGFATAQGGWLIINSDGSYLYTAPDSVDNTNPVSEVFTYTLTDSDGSTDTATLTLTVTDTGVDAVNDVNSVAEGDVDNDGINNITSGNVITENDEQGNDTPATITAISGGNVGATGFATAQGGWLIINSDGSYLYTAPDSVDNTNPVSEVFTYTLTDSDGSTDTATLTLTVTDTGVDAVNDVNSVAEGDVDNDGTNNITSGNVITENDEQGNDTPATITAISGGNVGATGFATAQGGWLIINSDGSYLYTAPDSVDNTNPVSEVFTYTLTDSDGSTDTATLTLTVTDTGVDAVNDVNSVAEGDVDNDGTNNITSGNVITENDEQGNDTPATITAISGGNVGATGFATAQGGWLIINSDGSYLYTAPDSVDNTNPVSEVFTYTLTDSDGSTDTATLTLTVTDTGVDAVNDVNSVAEGDVDNNGTNNITSGNVITENDEQGNDTPATITAISGGNVGATGFATAQGGWLIINSDGSYLYTAPDSVDNTNPVSEVFTYTLTDSDGSTDTATLTLTVTDTGVDAVNDVNSVAEGDVDNDGTNNITSGNVITENDEQGNDTPATITAISGGNVGATGFATAQGGWLIINSDGSYLYTAPDSVDNTNPVSEVFTYTLTDSDGSTDTATLTLTVTDTGVDAVNDVNSVAEGDADNDGTNNITSGNVITENDEQGNDTPATITAISGGNVGATGFATAQGGWLIINSDGSYLYTAPDSVDNTNPVSEVFTYTLTDSDGSTDTATLTLTVTDTGVDAVNDVNSVAEGDVDNDGTNNITSGNVITENDEQGNDTPATITAISGGNVGATGFATAQGGWLIINSDGSYLYTAPDSVDNTNPVSEVFTYTLTDSDGSTDTATLTLTVTDTGVDAVNDVNSVAEGDADNDGTNNITSGNVITENDEQGNDTPATITAISGGNVGATGFATAQGGWLIINSDGSYLYTAPDSVDNTNPVSEVFTYTLTDSDGSTDTATLTLTVTDTGVDAVNDVNSVAEGDVDNDGTNNITSGNVITENDEQGNDTPATITAISGGNVGATGFATAQGGWLIINSDGSYLYTAPDSVDNTNPVSEVFTYTLTDSDGSTDTATLTLTVTDTGVDAVNDVNSVAEGDVDNDGTNNITSGNVITENDEQGNDTPATITAISGGNVGATGFATAQGGWLIINSDGSYLYTAPDSVDNTNPVSEVFTYTLTDSDGSTDTATLTLTVTDTGVDAVNDVNSVAEGDVDNNGTNNITSGNVITENDEQGNDTPATITAISGGNVGATGFATAQGGWLIINSDGSYLYTAPDSVDNTNPVSEVFTYTLTDSDGSTDTATLTLTVTDTGVDAVNDVNSVAEGDVDNDGTNNITSGNVITENDEQGNDTPATITAISGGNVGATGFATAQGGWLIINSDGSYLYTAPDSVDNTNPVSEVFTYTLTDSDGSTDTATLTLTVTDTGVDAVNDVNSVAEGDVDNNGTNNITSGNVITENDEQGNDTPATITAISGGNVGATGFATAQGGWLIINSDGSYLYTAPDSVDNTNPVSEVFTYTLTDSDGSTDTATLTLTVTDTGVDAVNDVNSVAEGDVDNDGTNNITSGNVITENDEQGNDTPATITAISGGNVGATGFATAQGGWLIINSDGSYLYTAPDSVDNTNPVSEVFTYTLTDSDGSTDTATLTLTVTDTGVDAVNDVNSVAEGDVDNNGTNNITSGNVITENDEQGNDTPATITAISGGNVGATGFATAQGGWLIINSDGSYLYTAPDSVDNTNPVSEVFTYTLTDSDGSTDTATLTLTVTDTGVDAVNDVNSVAEGDVDNDGTNNITSGNVITENDEQGNDTPATITAISGGNVGATGFATAQGGWLIINSDGSYLYTAPDSVDNTNPVSEVFTYTLTDSDGSTDTATLTIDIEDAMPINTALLITNTNIEIQGIEIAITSPNGLPMTSVMEQSDVQGQEGTRFMFDDPVVFATGETYVVTVEHISGSAIILTSLSITDDNGNVFDIYDGNIKLETGDTGNKTNPDGYIFNLTVSDSDSSLYTVNEAIGYEILNDILSLDTEGNKSDFILDFSGLSLNGGQDLFGDVETIDISGKGTGEDNIIYISAQDVLDLGTAGDSEIIIIGDVGDEVNLVDLDDSGAGTWTQTATGGGATTYTYNDGLLDIATVTIDDVLNTTLNTSTFDDM